MNTNFFITNQKKHASMPNYLKWGGIYIYYENDLKVSCEDNYILIGHAYSYNDAFSSKELLQRLNSSSSQIDVEDILYFLGGRFVLLYNNHVYMDYAGLYGLYYYISEDKWVISSSLIFFNEVYGVGFIQNKPEFKWGEFINYFPSPLTMLDKVKKLMNYEGLYFDKNTCWCIQRHKKSKIFNNSNDDLFIMIKNSSKRFFDELHDEFGENIALELTAGVDSRTTLALMVLSGYKPYAYSNWTPEFKKYDKNIPQKISKMLGIPYTFLDKKMMGAFNEKKQIEYDYQVCYSVNDGDRFSYSHSLEILNKDYVVLRSGIYESIIDFYKRKFDDFYGKDEFLEQLNLINKGLNENVLASIKIWLENFEENEVSKESDFLNRFYLEQRSGAWTSIIELGNELKNYTTIHPANCAFFMDLLRSFPKEMHSNHKKDHQKFIIEKANDKLAKYSYNPSIMGNIKTILRTNFPSFYSWLRRKF